MAAAEHKLTRRALLAGACAVPVLPLSRHSGLDPESMDTAATHSRTVEFMDPRLRGDDGQWRRALASYARAVAGLDRVAHSEDDHVYDRALGRHNRALERLLAAAAPDLRAAAGKLELIVRHSVFELNFGEAALEALLGDLRGFSSKDAE